MGGATALRRVLLLALLGIAMHACAVAAQVADDDESVEAGDGSCEFFGGRPPVRQISSDGEYVAAACECRFIVVEPVNQRASGVYVLSISHSFARFDLLRNAAISCRIARGMGKTRAATRMSCAPSSLRRQCVRAAACALPLP